MIIWEKVETGLKSSMNEMEILACLSAQFNPSIYLWALILLPHFSKLTASCKEFLMSCIQRDAGD